MIDKNSADYVVLELAVKHFGDKEQMHKLQNELCELASEVGKYVEERFDANKLIDEMADVLVTINYPMIIMGENFEDLVKERVKFKIDRLDKIIISERIANNAGDSK